MSCLQRCPLGDKILTLWGAQGRPGNGGQSRAGIAAHVSPGGAPLCRARGLEAWADPGPALVGLGQEGAPGPAGIQVGYRGGLPAPAAGRILPVITGEGEREFALRSIVRRQVK